MRRSSFFLSILSWAFTLQLQAQPHSPDLPVSSRPFDFYERGPYRPELPRPSNFFGYETGDFLTTFALYESLLREYQQHSDRLRVFTIGQTPEHRALYLLAVSSPGNLAHLDLIKEQLGKLADPRKLKAGPELDQLIEKMPIVVWLSYSIHGSESAAFEAGIQVLYQLLASNDLALSGRWITLWSSSTLAKTRTVTSVSPPGITLTESAGRNILLMSTKSHGPLAAG